MESVRTEITKQQIRVITDNFAGTFESRVNILLARGWFIQSSNVFLATVNGNQYPTYFFSAILISNGVTTS